MTGWLGLNKSFGDGQERESHRLVRAARLTFNGWHAAITTGNAPDNALNGCGSMSARLCRLWMLGAALLLPAGCVPTRPSWHDDQAILDRCKVPVYISRTAAGTQCLSQCEERGIQCATFCHNILCVCECNEAETVCIEGCPTW